MTEMTDENGLKEIYNSISDKISWEDFCEKLEEKRDLLGGLCDDMMCARIIVSEFGEDASTSGPITIDKVKEAQGNVAFKARVLTVYEPREFNRSDGTIGRVANMFVADNTGRIRVSIWDEKVQGILSNDIVPGVTLNIAGYTKPGLNGVEVHVGNSGILALSDEEIELVTAEKQIGELTTEIGDVSVLGKVVDIGQLRLFQRNDGTEGRVCNVTLGDDTGTIRLSLWDEKADFITDEVKVGDTLRVNNGYTKINNFSGNVELSIGAMGTVQKSDEMVEYTVKFTKVGEITEGMNDVNLAGKVLDISDIRTFMRKDGTEGKVSNVTLGDNTGTIRLSLWDEKAEFIADEIKVGDTLKVNNGYTKINNFSGNVELNLGAAGTVQKSDEPVEYTVKFTKIEDVLDGMNGINVTGKILDISDIRSFSRKDGTEGHVGSIIIGDETGKIRVNVWDDKTIYLDEFDFDETVDITNTYSRVNSFSGTVELNLGNRGNMILSENEIEYQEKTDKIKDILPGKTYNVQGRVIGIGEYREFERDDGTQNAVSNIEIEDETGTIRIALWGEHARFSEQVQIGMQVRLSDIFSKFGMNEDIELSAGNRTRIKIVE